MTPVILSPRASDDEALIVEFLAKEGGVRVALDYRARFRDLYRLLEEQPEIGIRRPELGRGIRRSVVAPYLVFYRRLPEAVIVLRILHGRRQITAALVRRRL